MPIIHLNYKTTFDFLGKSGQEKIGWRGQRGTEERMEDGGRKEEDREQDRAMRAGEDAIYCSTQE